MRQPKRKLAVAVGALPAAALQALGEEVPASEVDQEKKLIAVLKSGLKQKMDACRELAVIGGKDAVPTLVALLADEKLSHMARYALEPMSDSAVDEAFRKALDRLKGRQLVGVIGSIGVRRDAKAVGQLSRLLDSDDPDVVQATARSLGRIATPEAAKALTAKLGKAPENVRLAVADGCLGCAEACLADAKRRGEAAALYQSVAKAEVPKYVRAAATEGAALAR